MNDRFWELEVDINVVSIYIQHPYDSTSFTITFSFNFLFYLHEVFVEIIAEWRDSRNYARSAIYGDG